MRRRNAVAGRTGWICERCHDRIVEEIHHLNGNLGDNRLENLTAVCKDCHMALERDARANRVHGS
jgi:5-methylcytosine-specific restriction endonuclease McrA